MLVSRKHRKLVLNLRDPDRITAVIPTAKVINYQGQNLVAVPHRLDEVKVLRNLGFDAPMPMRYYYDWPGGKTPFEHQYVTSEFLVANPKCFCLNGMGSGKTISALWSFDYLRKLGEVRRMLVISPLSTLERTWGDEIFGNFPDMTFAVLHGDRARRHKLIDTDFDVYIINHDGIKNKDTLAKIIARADIDLIVVDEIASFRNYDTDRFKFLKKLTESRKWVWGLTGTPTPNAPTDAWAQCRLICPARVPSYYSHFRDQVMKQVSSFKWGPRDGALEIVREAMQPAIRFAREDCIDLPPTTVVTRQTTLTDAQEKLYEEMMKSLKAEHTSGQIVALNEAIKLSKIVQICCGVAYGIDGDVVEPAKPRVDLVKEIITESEGKVIVFVPLTGALDAVATELAKHWDVSVVHGAVSKTARDEIFSAFQKSASPHVLVANPATMSHGLTLTAASTIVWFAPINSNEVYEQACARIVRPGQKRNTLIVNIEATPVERHMYARLQKKGKMQGVLLDMLK